MTNRYSCARYLPWNDEQLAMLREHFDRGISIRTAARIMSVHFDRTITHSQIVAKRRRLGMRCPERKRLNTPLNPRHPPRTRRELALIDSSPQVYASLPIWAVGNNDCRWIVGHEGYEALFCAPTCIMKEPSRIAGARIIVG
jgi:hypothetical protein